MSKMVDEYLQVLQDDNISEAAISPTTALFIVPTAISLAAKAYKAFIDKAEKTCRDYTGLEKTKCLKRFRAQAVKAKIATLNKAKGMCAKDKNPEKCREKLAGQISKLNAKLKMIQF